MPSRVVSAPEKVLPDANVLFSGVLFAGKPGALLEAARHGRIRALTSLQLEAEVSGLEIVTVAEMIERLIR